MGICLSDHLLQSVEAKITMQYYRQETAPQYDAPPRERCEAQGNIWSVPIEAR